MRKSRTKGTQGDASGSGEETRYFTATDRCDRCPAQAYISAIVLSPSVGPVELLFCGHHFTRHEDRLREAAAMITDHRQQIEPVR